MADVTISIGGRPHIVATRDGEEARIRQLASMLDSRWEVANRAAGGLNSERAMLFMALMLADDLDESERRLPEGATVSEAALQRIADRLESLAQALEHTPPSA